ncbi:hypothetical protein RS584_15005 [Enterobacter sp. DTU_2021_1002640_1_SI_PRY_ASU_LCPMC_013]|uniref:hypothetical protein n=1 Tax=Enterobacter sp. DTU_2021_1002640_1_SI_PRY_ASU_LCPMC_013 TaxID=3077940 RepID=UPI0027FA7D37|nr:hypothetical protein [Enterobacter sp. DTU_2021_1002640_1_SI_PRY_ASU_LCPMC_013]EKY3920609.1 hypothetical protein [Enterobacter hormaechei]WNU99020.1 hypothetical protein RS584_15005 [Enterobacter sp. DTU_2021_1002640_1_SI_PRY_ASU_LCPMC_013]
MIPAWLRWRWLFNRRVGYALLLTVLLFAMAIAINVIGIRVLGSIESWERWMDEHTGYFLAWRLLLYTGIACGWRWMRKRVLDREPGTASHERLIRVEIAGVAALVVLEGSLLLQSP